MGEGWGEGDEEIDSPATPAAIFHLTPKDSQTLRRLRSNRLEGYGGRHLPPKLMDANFFLQYFTPA
jgi:hypothetical protein